MAEDFKDCLAILQRMEKPASPKFLNGTLWCNATFDNFLCWPAIPANSTYAQHCPDLSGLMPEKQVIKHCHETGRWSGENGSDFSSVHGYTNYVPCMKFDPVTFAHAQKIAADARKLEYVGLSLSLISLMASIVIFSVFRQLRVFRNQMHQQLMLSLLLNATIRLVLYIDQAVGSGTAPKGNTIHSTKYMCETFYLLLEYLKTAAFTFSLLEGYYLHNRVVVKVFQDVEPKLRTYLSIGWGLPVFHVLVWIFAIIVLSKDSGLKKCLGDYYMTSVYFWIMDILRLSELLVSFVFLLNIIYVLWLKVKETHNTSEIEQIKKSVKAVMMLIPLLGLPNILQTIPFTPNAYNLTFFAVYTFCASFFFMFQGLMVAVIFCFTNKEVINVVQSRWKRYRQGHQMAHRLRQVSAAGSLGVRTLNAARAPSTKGGYAAGGHGHGHQWRQLDEVECAPLAATLSHLRPPLAAAVEPPSYDEAVMMPRRGNDFTGQGSHDASDVLVGDLAENDVTDELPYNELSSHYAAATSLQQGNTSKRSAGTLDDASEVRGGKENGSAIRTFS